MQLFVLPSEEVVKKMLSEEYDELAQKQMTNEKLELLFELTKNRLSDREMGRFFIGLLLNIPCDRAGVLFKQISDELFLEAFKNHLFFSKISKPVTKKHCHRLRRIERRERREG